MSTSLQINNKHIILIAVSVLCVGAAIALFCVYFFSRPQYELTAEEKKMLAGASDEAMITRIKRVSNTSGFPSPSMKRLLAKYKAKYGENSDDALLVKFILDEKQGATFRHAFMVAIDERVDYPYLLSAYGQMIDILDLKRGGPEITFTVNEGEPPKDLGHDQVTNVLESLFVPATHTCHHIEIAGLPKHEKSRQIAAIKPIHHSSPHRAVGYYGDDTAGVSSDGRVLVVADGVGSAERSHLASRAAVDIILEYFERHPGDSLFDQARKLIDSIVLFFKLFGLTGKTTLVVAQIAAGNEVRVLSVGDSGCAIVDASGKMIMMTPVGEESPNTPHQLPTSALKNMAEAVRLFKMKAPSGSKVMLYSDGVSDNLWPMAMAKRASCAANLAASAIHMYFENKSDDIPFNVHGKPSRKAKGKQDDVSAIVYKVQ